MVSLSAKGLTTRNGRARGTHTPPRYAPAIKEVIEFFDHSWLAKDLYSEAGLDAAERIE